MISEHGSQTKCFPFLGLEIQYNRRKLRTPYHKFCSGKEAENESPQEFLQSSTISHRGYGREGGVIK
jgi:hypothetical protein